MSNHCCHSLVFRCMDFRIKPSVLSELLAEEGCNEGCYDMVSLAGSAKDLLGSEAERLTLLKQISLSQKLHQTSKIMVLYHDNCGVYDIADPEQERRVQLTDLAAIKSLIKEKFPDLGFVAYIIKGVVLGNLSLEKIQ